MKNYIVAIKDNKYYFNTPNKIGDIIGCTGRNLTEHIKNGKEVLAINGYVVYLKGDNMKYKSK
jgi:uncharacterized Zn-binding protein involved in type VI secretion